MKRIFALVLSLALLLSAAALADEQAEMVLAVAVNELGYAATKGGYSGAEKRTASGAPSSFPGA